MWSSNMIMKDYTQLSKKDMAQPRELKKIKEWLHFQKASLHYNYQWHDDDFVILNILCVSWSYYYDSSLVSHILKDALLPRFKIKAYNLGIPFGRLCQTNLFTWAFLNQSRPVWIFPNSKFNRLEWVAMYYVQYQSQVLQSSSHLILNWELPPPDCELRVPWRRGGRFPQLSCLCVPYGHRSTWQRQLLTDSLFFSPQSDPTPVLPPGS